VEKASSSSTPDLSCCSSVDVTETVPKGVHPIRIFDGFKHSLIGKETVEIRLPSRESSVECAP
jgi:hypothetical protein